MAVSSRLYRSPCRGYRADGCEIMCACYSDGYGSNKRKERSFYNVLRFAQSLCFVRCWRIHALRAKRCPFKTCQVSFPLFVNLSWTACSLDYGCTSRGEDCTPFLSAATGLGRLAPRGGSHSGNSQEGAAEPISEEMVNAGGPQSQVLTNVTPAGRAPPLEGQSFPERWTCFQ